MANVEDLDEPFGFIHSKDNPVGFKDQMTQGVFEVFVLSCQWAALGHQLN